MVHQIRVVAVLLMVHGVLAFAMGLLYIGMGLLMPYVTSASGGPFRGGNQQLAFQTMFWVYFAMGGPALIAGGVQVVAGWRAYDLRSRRLAIAAVLSGVIASSTCYCAPTAIMMAIYGLVVLLNSTVAQAFAWRAEGAAAHQVFARLFAPYAQWSPSPAAAESSARDSLTESAPPQKTPPGTEPPSTTP